MDLQLTDKTVVVTGAASGIGAAAAKLPLLALSTSLATEFGRQGIRSVTVCAKARRCR